MEKQDKVKLNPQARAGLSRHIAALEDATRVRNAAAVTAQVGSVKAGDMVEGEGVFIGRYVPRDTFGKALSRAFNVFAAPEDLRPPQGGGVAYAAAAAQLGTLKNWHGHKGRDILSDTELNTALANGSYKGEWVLPPLEVMSGLNAKNERVQEDTVNAVADRGALGNTFHVKGGAQSFYWTCTPAQSFPRSQRITSFITASGASGASTADEKLSCRPVRFVPVKKALP